MRSILISIHPKWVELIASGLKTVEIRKNKPKIETPFKVYIYCTAEIPNGKNHVTCLQHENGETLNRKVIGEFVCDKITEFTSEFWNDDSVFQQLSEVVRWDDEDVEEYTICSNEDYNPDNCDLCENSCLSFREIQKYVGIGDKSFYAWHISNLVIYDKPKELSDFVKANAEPFEKLDGRGVLCEYCAYREVNGYDEISNTWFDCGECDCWEAYQEYIKIKYPPQSWCYVKEMTS